MAVQPDIGITIGVEGDGQAKKKLNVLERSVLKLGKAAGVALKRTAQVATVALSAFVALGIQGAISLEQTQIQLENFTGSAEAATKVLDQIETFAAKTPFQFPELADSTRKLLAFGVEQEKVLPTLKAIGDISAGTGVRVSELSEIYGKARVQGRLFAEDVNQLTGRGIPIIGELAKQFGVAESEVKKLVSEGKVGFPAIEKAFASLTSEGGKFAGLTERLSDSTAGRLSTLKDNFAKLAREVGKKFLPIISDAAKTLTISIQRVFFGMQNLEGGSKRLDAALGFVKLAIEGIIKSATIVISSLASIGKAINSVFKIFDDTFGGFAPIIQAEQAKAKKATDEFFNSFAEKVGISGTVLAKFKATLGDFDIARRADIVTKDLNARFIEFINTEARAIRKTKTLADGLDGGGTGLGDKVQAAAGSIEYLQTKLKDAEESFNLAATAAGREGFAKEIDSLNLELLQLEQGSIRAVSTMNELQSSLGADGVDKQLGFAVGNQLRKANSEFESFAQFAETLIPPAISKFNELGEAVKGLGAEFADIGKGAIMDFANGFSGAVASVVSGQKTMGEALKQLALEVLATGLKTGGLVLIQSALSVPFPANLPLLGAGLVLLGASGIATGIAQRSAGGAAAQAPAPAVAPASSPVAGPGLSQFTGESFEVSPVVNVMVEIDGDELASKTRQVQRERGRRAGR